MPSLPSRTEFIALMAMLSATVAFSIDAMLPALPAIAAALAGGDVAAVQLVVSAFVLGMGIGTLFTGPLSDRYGRKPVMLAGAALYIVGAVAAALAQSLEILLAARLVQGLGAAGPRVVAQAVVRDLYSGRQMAQVLSFVMMVFTVVPAVGPLIGAGLVQLGGWPAIFWAFVVFALLSSAWLALRLPETLPPARRRPFRLPALRSAAAEMARHPTVRLAIAVQVLTFGTLFSLISSVQPIFDVAFDRGESFPLWFGALALLSAFSSVINARLVIRLGMQRMVRTVYAGGLVVSLLCLAVLLAGLPVVVEFAAFVIWLQAAFFLAGMTIGNLNALALEPMGHVAGTAASVMGAVATVGGVLLSAPIALMFDGTAVPLLTGCVLMSAAALALAVRLGRAEAALSA